MAVSQEAMMNSFLVYVDSERSKNANSTGSNIIVPMNMSGLNVGDGEFIRLSVVNFSMIRNYPKINDTNNICRILGTRTIPPVPPVVFPAFTAIAAGNYDQLFGLASAFATGLAAQILALIIAPPYAGTVTQVAIITTPPNGVQPPATYVMGQGSPTGGMGTFGALFEAQDAGGVAQPHGLTSLIIRMLVSDGDNFVIMGGDRIRDDNDLTTNSMNTIFMGPNNILVIGKYPMQLYSDEFICLRTDLQSNNMQTPSFNAGNTDRQIGQVEGSRILCRVPSLNALNYFQTNTQREYFLNLMQRSVPELTLFLTDSKSRPLPFTAGDDTLGNLSFSCVILVEVIRNKEITMANLKPVIQPIPARLSAVPLIEPDDGVDTYQTPLIGRLAIRR